MKRSVTFLAILACALCADASGGSSEPLDISKIKPDRLPFRFEIRRTLGNVNEYFAADIDGDAEDEIVNLILKSTTGTAPNAIEVDGVDLNEVYFRRNFSNPVWPSPMVADVEDRDGKNEIFVQETKPDGVFFHVLDWKGGIAMSLEAAHRPPGAGKIWECGVSALASMDVNHDGYLDLVILVYTTYGYQPREVCVLDVRNRRWLWKYPVGFAFTQLVLADVNSDGKREIVLGSTSPGNIESSHGRPVNGTDDLHTYVTVLDSLGRLLRCQQVGGVFEGVSVFASDINGDGKTEILVRSDCHRKPKISGTIAQWNPMTGVFGPEISLEKTPSKNIVFLDADRDGRVEFAAGWDDGTLEIDNCRFECLARRRFSGFSIEGLKTADLNRDGDEEVLVFGMVHDQYRILALDRKLRLLAMYDQNALFSIEAECIANPGYGKDKLLIAHGYGDAPSRLLSLERSVLPVLDVPWTWMGLGVLAGALLTWAAVFLFPRRRGAGTASIGNLVDSIHMGLFILDSDGRLVLMNRSMEHFLGAEGRTRIGESYADVFKNSSYEPVAAILRQAFQKKKDFTEEETRIEDSFGEYREILVSVSVFSPSADSSAPGKLVLIQNITGVAESKRAAVWASIAQRLAHEIKTPLSSVMLSAQRIKMECENNPDELRRYEKYIGHITGQVDRLRKMTDAFMKFARVEKPAFGPCNVTEIIQEVLSDSRLKMGSGIQVKVQCEQDVPKVSADRQQMSVAIQNLIDNSLNAMEGRGQLTVAVRLVQSLYKNHVQGAKEAIQIEISDTGKGISRKHLSQLFQPFFSKSVSGTGLGLVIVKKIIEDHHGLIRIESEEGIGTTVFVTLPVNKRKENIGMR
jgi:PAS domain S-box-containing protein